MGNAALSIIEGITSEIQHEAFFVNYLRISGRGHAR